MQLGSIYLLTKFSNCFHSDLSIAEGHFDSAYDALVKNDSQDYYNRTA